MKRIENISGVFQEKKRNMNKLSFIAQFKIEFSESCRKVLRKMPGTIQENSKKLYTKYYENKVNVCSKIIVTLKLIW